MPQNYTPTEVYLPARALSGLEINRSVAFVPRDAKVGDVFAGREYAVQGKLLEVFHMSDLVTEQPTVVKLRVRGKGEDESQWFDVPLDRAVTIAAASESF